MFEAYKHILEPIRLGNVRVRNRVLMAAHSYGYTDNAGNPTDFLVDYLAERAKGGIGLVIMGGTAVSKEGSLNGGLCSIDDGTIGWYQRISKTVHDNGAVVFDQLTHAGGLKTAREGVRIVAPSAIPHQRTRGIPVELSVPEIQKIIRDFVVAAQRAEKGGLDGVELKCDQGFLIHQFLSPHYNRRSDDYGGSYDRRIRFLLEVIERIRDSVSRDFVLGIRMSGDALYPGDLSLNIPWPITSSTNILGSGTPIR